MLLLTAAFFIQFFSLDPDGGVSQLIPICLICAEAIRCVFMQVNIFSLRLNYSAVFFALILPVQSSLLGLSNGNITVVEYSVAYFVCVVSVMKIYKVFGLEKIINCFLLATNAFIVYILIYATNELLSALTADVINIGSSRFSEFGIHPNLYGHIYAVATIASVWNAFECKGVRRFYYLSSAIASILIIAAASSRGGMICALLSSAFLYYKFQIKIKSNLSVRSVLVNGGLIVMVGALIGNFVYKSLDIDSQYRGVGSGFSGRAENWGFLWDEISQSFMSLIFGGGFRSYDPFVSNVHTDNSYINFALEFGVPVTFVLMGFLVLRLYQCYKESEDYRGLLVFALLLGVLTESFVARYLIGIGNPASIVVLIILLCNELNVSKKNAA
jgi:hypothetical protein